MIEEVTLYSTQQMQLSETKTVTGDLEQSLMSQRHQMEQILQVPKYRETLFWSVIKI
jgi:hypothetical protein